MKYNCPTELGLSVDVVGAFEINPGALLSYSHNFPSHSTLGKNKTTEAPTTDSTIATVTRRDKRKKQLLQAAKPRNLLGLTTEEWTRLDPDLLVMSPPCQPFTRYPRRR